MPNIQIQKTGAGSAGQSDQSMPASDLERWEALAQLERLLLQAWQMAWKPLGR